MSTTSEQIRSNTEINNRKFKASQQALRNHYFGLSRRVLDWCEQSSIGAPNVVGITSPNRQVGVSTVSYNLAVALGEQLREKTLLLQADVGNGFASRKLKTRNQPGFTELISETHLIEDCVVPTKHQYLSVVGPGLFKGRDYMSLPLENSSNAFDQARENYRFVVVDLPIACRLTTCYSLSRYLDGVLIVCQEERTETEDLIQCRKDLVAANTQIIGAIVNKSNKPK